jgi:hypothetical protein
LTTCFVHRLPTIEDADDVKYDLRSIFPVIDFHVPLIIAVFAGYRGDAEAAW